MVFNNKRKISTMRITNAKGEQKLYTPAIILWDRSFVVSSYSFSGVVNSSFEERLKRIIFHASIWVRKAFFVLYNDVLNIAPHFLSRIEYEVRRIIKVMRHIWEF